MKLNDLIKETKVEGGNEITTTDNFDIIPVKFGEVQRKLIGKKLTKEWKPKKKKKKKKRKKVDINWGPDAYAPYAGE